MPLVRITARDSRSEKTLRAVGDAVHDALVTYFAVPEGDRLQIRERVGAGVLEADQFFGFERRDPVVVEVTLRGGRTPEMKRAFYAAVAKGVHERAAVSPRDVTIVLRENGSPDWSFGDGIAQYAPEEVPA